MSEEEVKVQFSEGPSEDSLRWHLQTLKESGEVTIVDIWERATQAEENYMGKV